MEFLPWYNIKLIHFLNNFLQKNFDIFEYGGGNSTLYYASKVKSVSTIEGKQEWIDFINKNKQNLHNIKVQKCNIIQNFSLEINNFTTKEFDIVVVDSRDRAKCLMQSVKHLKQNGIIILDNSERANLIDAKQSITKMGFQEDLFCGFRNDGTFSIASIFSKNLRF